MQFLRGLLCTNRSESGHLWCLLKKEGSRSRNIAMVVVRLALAVVTTSLVILAGLVTFSEGRNRHEVVDGGASTAPMLLMGQWVRGNIEDDR